MNSTSQLIDTAQALMAGQKGILAIDESNATGNKRFAALGIPQPVEARRVWRELLRRRCCIARCNQAARQGKLVATMKTELA